MSFNIKAYQQAKLEAILDPPKEREFKKIGDYWYIWYEGKWAYPTSREIKRVEIENGSCS